MVTLKDIAAHVGVSISAVSLVLNERGEGRVRPDVAARIRNVADELGYAPNLLARGLKTNQSHTIGLLSDQVATVPFAGAMLAGAQNAAAAEDFLLIVVDTAGNRDLDSHAVKTLLQRNIEGLILATDFHRDVDLPMVPRTVPIVVLDGRPSDRGAMADWVIPDEQQGAFIATQALTRAGHRRIAFAGDAPSVPTPAAATTRPRASTLDHGRSRPGPPPAPPGRSPHRRVLFLRSDRVRVLSGGSGAGLADPG